MLVPMNTNKTILSLREVINSNVNEICYGSKYAVTYSLRSISQKYFSTISTLHVPTSEHYNLMDENNRIDSIEFEISV